MGAYLLPALCILVVASFLAGLPYAMMQPAPLPRQRVIDSLNRTGLKHLVFVRYGANHIAVEAEWVYNDADLHASPVIWAWDMGAQENRQVAQDYPGRRIWLVEPDRDPMKLIEYTF
jgi:hypothetical protein